MSDKKTKIECHLTTKGTDGANSKAVGDLTIPDPDPSIGKKILQEAMEEETEDECQPEDS
jgi:hypothetical protein